MARLTRWGVRPRGEIVVPRRLRRAFTVRLRKRFARVLEDDALAELQTRAEPDPAPPSDEWDEGALLETFERTVDPESNLEVDPDVEHEIDAPIALARPRAIDLQRFAAAVRSKVHTAPATRPVALETAKQEPHLGRTHTNGCYGSRFDLRAKGLLIECGQCDRAVTAPEAAACRDRFCKVGKAAAAKRVGFA